MWKLSFLLCLAVAVGCATVTRGVEEVFLVESEPVGANVALVWDEPAVLFEEDHSSTTRGTESEGDPGVEIDKKTITFSRLEGTTPVIFKIPRKGVFTVTITKEGYKPVTMRVLTQVATAGGAALAGNLCFMGCLTPIGGVVDATSGATLEHVPAAINVKLEKIGEYKEENPTHEPPSKRGVVVE